ncbi:PepSY-associated TM region [Tropicibacter naphthalenivorans]|uniref:Putative iron-regulated membrane protein n=1 Tax=Tropicibacter naphthalenivorans TaxID=441103 RepID=A0A0P1GGI7_9RHOB|nr:putative iron-regulated membrane protein [Tropicibacter naphthalenivorans]SMC88062.1 PepSY-associated TM region [Tropicibacter naphthalenivorans]
MIRGLHRWPGLLALGVITVLALSGAALAVFPALERVSAPQADRGLSVATLAERVQTVYPGVEEIRRSPSGKITVYWFDAGAPGAAVIDPETGQGVASADPNQIARWLTNLHRSLFLGDAGRLTMALGAAAMLVFALWGVALVARRAGGWRHWFAPLRGPMAGRLHVELARFAVLGLTLSSVTALWMTAVTFGVLPEGDTAPAFPREVSMDTGAAPSEMPLLTQTPVAELRTLHYPYAGDASDVYTLQIAKGSG